MINSIYRPRLLSLGINLPDALESISADTQIRIIRCGICIQRLKDLGYSIASNGKKSGRYSHYKLYIYGPGVEVPIRHSSKKAAMVFKICYMHGQWFVKLDDLISQTNDALLEAIGALSLPFADQGVAA